MSGLGERGSRLRSVARRLAEPPAVPPFYIQVPEGGELRAIGWYMRMTRDGEAIFLGHSAASAEVFLLRRLEDRAIR